MNIRENKVHVKIKCSMVGDIVHDCTSTYKHIHCTYWYMTIQIWYYIHMYMYMHVHQGRIEKERACNAFIDSTVSIVTINRYPCTNVEVHVLYVDGRRGGVMRVCGCQILSRLREWYVYNVWRWKGQPIPMSLRPLPNVLAAVVRWRLSRLLEIYWKNTTDCGSKETILYLPTLAPACHEGRQTCNRVCSCMGRSICRSIRGTCDQQEAFQFQNLVTIATMPSMKCACPLFFYTP